MLTVEAKRAKLLTITADYAVRAMGTADVFAGVLPIALPKKL